LPAVEIEFRQLKYVIFVLDSGPNVNSQNSGPFQLNILILFMIDGCWLEIAF